MFCEKCEGEYFVLLFDAYIGPVESTGTGKLWQLWKCLECGRYKRIEKERITKQKNDKGRRSI